jgi:hypothetical protein
MKAEFPGTCYICGQPIFVGDEIMIIRASKRDWELPPVARHVECDPNPVVVIVTRKKRVA